MDIGTFRRAVAVIATAGFMPAALIANLVGPSRERDGLDSFAAFLDFAAREPDRFVGWTVGLLISVVLLVPAIFGIAQPIRGRGATLAQLGVAIGTLGALGHMSIVTRNVFFQAMAGGPRAEMVALGDRFFMSMSNAALLFPLIMVYGVGLLLLIAATWRAGIVPAWAPLIVLVVVVVDIAKGGLPLPVPDYVFWALRDGLGVVVFGRVAVGLLRLPSAMWADGEATDRGSHAKEPHP